MLSDVHGQRGRHLDVQSGTEKLSVVHDKVTVSRVGRVVGQSSDRNWTRNGLHDRNLFLVLWFDEKFTWLVHLKYYMTWPM